MKNVKVKNRNPTTTYRLYGENAKNDVVELLNTMNGVEIARVLLDDEFVEVEVCIRNQHGQCRTRSLDGNQRDLCSQLLMKLGYDETAE